MLSLGVVTLGEDTKKAKKSSEMQLEPLATEEAGKRSEYLKRRTLYLEETIPASKLEEYEERGWSVARTNRSGSLRVKKQKLLDQQLEDEAWCILYQLGYKTLNIGRKLEMPLGKEVDAPTEQVEVFAYDDASIVIFRCKTSEKRTARRLVPAIREFSKLRKQISDSLRRHFGGEFRQKVIWAFVTRKIFWSPKDLDRAKAANINVIRDTEIAYFSRDLSADRRGCQVPVPSRISQDFEIPRERQSIRTPYEFGWRDRI